MNTLLDTRPSVVDVPAWQATPAKRLTLADRVALRVGLALVLWARRPVAEEPQVATRRALAAAGVEARRAADERTLRLLLPPR